MSRKERKAKAEQRRLDMQIAWLNRLNELTADETIENPWDKLCMEISKQVGDCPNRANDVRIAFATMYEELDVQLKQALEPMEQELEPIKLSGNMVEVPLVQDHTGDSYEPAKQEATA